MGADRILNKAARVIKLTLEHFRETGLDYSDFLAKISLIIFGNYQEIASLVVDGNFLVFFKGTNGFHFQMITYEPDEAVNQWRALLADKFGEDFIFRTRSHHEPKKLLEELAISLKRLQVFLKEKDLMPEKIPKQAG